MALQHKLSDAITMHLDVDLQNNPVLDIEFRFVRYRLVIDDLQKVSEMIELLRRVPTKKQDVKGPVEMPHFYGKIKKNDQLN